MRRQILSAYKNAALLLLLTCAAFSILGYHPGIEDDTTYLAAVKHDLNPALYPHDLVFVTSQLQLSMYDTLIAGSIRWTHLPPATAILLWQFAGLYALLGGCRLIVAACFPQASARWAGVSFVAVMLAMPVSHTCLFLADQHLHPRLLATDCIVFAVAALLRQRQLLAIPLLAAAAFLHPLMAAFGISFCSLLMLEQKHAGWWISGWKPLRLAAVPWLLEPSTAPWAQATVPRTFLYLYQWPWYGWLTIFAPVAAAAWLRSAAQRRDETTLAQLSSTIVVYSSLQLAVAMVLLLPGAPAWFVQLEPMRFLHLTYLLTALLGAAAFGRWWLGHSPWRWLLVFLPLSATMILDQQQEFAGSPHIEWPGAHPGNAWLQAFAWVRSNTPVDAYFALDPLYTELPEEGTHSFRALAERSMLADAVKDRGVVTHVPHLAERWVRETDARAGWSRFGQGDFKQLHDEFGVDWILLAKPSAEALAGLRCPYHNTKVWVCRVAPSY